MHKNQKEDGRVPEQAETCTTVGSEESGDIMFFGNSSSSMNNPVQVTRIKIAQQLILVLYAFVIHRLEHF